MKKSALILLLTFCSISILSAQDIQNDSLIVGIYESPPFVTFDKLGKPSGLSIWLWERVSSENNLAYTYKIYPENDSPLHRLQDDLESAKIDISINPLTITSSRSQRYSFSYPFYVGNLTIAQHTESNIEPISRFYSVFKNKRVFSLTIILGIMMVIFGLLIWIAERSKSSFEKGYHGVISGLWWSAVTMTTVGYGDKVPITKRGRFIAFIWMVISLVMVSIFTATMTSVLTVDQLMDEANNLNEIKKLSVGTVESSASEEYLRRNYFINVDTYPDLYDGLDGVLKGEIEVFIYDEPWLKYQLNNNDLYKDLEILPEVFNLEHYAWPIRKGVDIQIRERISTAILKEVESQEWHYILTDYGLIKK